MSLTFSSKNTKIWNEIFIVHSPKINEGDGVGVCGIQWSVVLDPEQWTLTTSSGHIYEQGQICDGYCAYLYMFVRIFCL